MQNPEVREKLKAIRIEMEKWFEEMEND